MKFNVLNCNEFAFEDSRTKEKRTMYRVSGIVNSLDIKNGLMQIITTKPVDSDCEYNCHLVVSSDMKTLKINFDSKIEGSKGLFNK